MKIEIRIEHRPGFNFPYEATASIGEIYVTGTGKTPKEAKEELVMNIALLRQKEPDRVETVEIDDSEDLSDEQAQRDEEDEAANDIAEANQELMSGHGQDEEESN